MRNGLGDRQAPVRAAAGKLIGTWVDLIGGGLVEFLQTFDLLGSEVAEDALLSVFVTRPDIFDNAAFDGKSNDLEVIGLFDGVQRPFGMS